MGTAQVRTRGAGGPLRREREAATGAATAPPSYGIGFVDERAALTRRFGPFLADKIQRGAMTIPQAERALRHYRGTEAGKRDLFFHDNAVAALAARDKLEASNIAVEGYEALAAAPELVASGRYKLLPNYRKNVVEQLEERLAEATVRARESGMEVLRRVYREQGAAAALDAAKGIASFADDPAAAVNVLVREEEQQKAAERRAELLHQTRERCKAELIAPDEICDEFFDNLDQQVEVGPDGELQFSDARLSAVAAKDWQLTAEERATRERRVSPEEKADREAARAARAALFRMDALEGAGKALSTGFYDLFIGMPGDLMTYGSNSLLGTNYAYSSSFGRELYAELAKGEGTDVERVGAELARGEAADMDAIQRELERGHFTAAQLDTIAYELRRGDRDFRKIRAILEEGRGTDPWKVADMVGKTAVDVGSTVLTLVPGAQGVGLMGKTARAANLVGDALFVYDTLSSARVGVDAALRGDGRGFGEAFGGVLQAPLMKYGGAGLARGLRAGAGWWSTRRAAGPVPIGGVDGDGWGDTFGEQYLGQISQAEQASAVAGHGVPGSYVHAVRRGNAFEFAGASNGAAFTQLLSHIRFEDRAATIDVGSGGHGGARGDSFLVDPRARDASFATADAGLAARAEAAARIWDLSDPQALRAWLDLRGSASAAGFGAPGRYAIADWCFSAFTGADGQGPMLPLLDWDARFDVWNRHQRGAGLAAPMAAGGGGLYMGSDVRAAQIAASGRGAPASAASKAAPDPVHAARSSDALAAAQAQRLAAIERQRVGALGGRVGQPLDPAGDYLRSQGTQRGTLHEKVQIDREFLAKKFPEIGPSKVEIVPQWRPGRYNCFGFTLGELSVPVQPSTARVLDPADPFKYVSEMYARKGYTLSRGLDFRSTGRGKIVVYGRLEGGKIVEFTHAAIQEADGMWTSKLGPEGPLVRHATPGAVSGAINGVPVAVYEPAR